MKIWRIHLFLFLGLLILTAADCKKNTPDDAPGNELITGTYDPTPYEWDLPEWISPPPIPEDNLMTIAGVELGRHLFYDPILSSDSTQACATCHQLEHSFTDGQSTSEGVLGMRGTRNAMALVNIAYNPNGFFWDGRSATLEEQALVPVEDHVELNESWENVVEKLRRHPEYPGRFKAAFGIERTGGLDKLLVVKAIAQFERTLISANSRFDQVTWVNGQWFNNTQQRGKLLFFIEDDQSVAHPGCSHCHVGPSFTNNDYKNNGLDDVADLADFADLGRGGVTNSQYDNGKFRVPTLRNIELTAPYMHDGRFQTLEEVLNHYSNGGHGVINEDPNIRPFPLTEQQKLDLIAFLKTLTDTTFIQNPAFKNPFEE